jgi:serine/threonine-protein kinase
MSDYEKMAHSRDVSDSPPSFDKGAFASFKPICEIGRGAHGTVFLAEGVGGKVALKICARPEEAERRADWERERRGWNLFAAIPPHRALVRVFQTGLTPDGAAFYIAMELADTEPGGSPDEPERYRPLTLASVASAEVALPLAQCLDIGERLASALEHLQRHHLLHRDIKPGNVLFVRGQPVIADAGLVVDDREAASLVGTPGYEPPEHHGTPQGDVFSLGRTLWRIATGRTPEEVDAAPCAEADTSDPDYPAFLAIVKRAMSDDPERRYRSAKAMRKALARLRRQRKLRRLRRVLMPLLAAACAALLLALAWALGRRSAGTTEPDPLDEIRKGIRLGKIHVMTPEEAKGIIGNINRDLKRSKEDLKSSLPTNQLSTNH